MTAEAVFWMRAMGRTVRVAATPSVPRGFLDALLRSWTDCAPQSGASGADGALAADDEGPLVVLHLPEESPETEDGAALVAVTGQEPWSQAQELFTTQTTVQLIRQHLGRRHLFHAATLMDPETGECLLLVGPSGRGKTTASRALAADGWAYLSDETACVDHQTAEVLPYPKPLSIIRTPGRPKAQQAPSALGLSVADPDSGPRPVVAGILLLDRRDPGEQAGAEDQAEAAASALPEIEPVPLNEGLQALAEQSSGLAATERGLEQMARLVQRAGGVHRVSYTESGTLAPALAEHLHRLRAQRPAVEGWVFVPPRRGPEERPAQEPHPVAEKPVVLPARAGTWARSSEASGLQAGETLLVLNGTRRVLLSAVAADLWLEAGDGVPAAQLEARLTEFYGPAPAGVLEDMLRELEDQQLLVHQPSGS